MLDEADEVANWAEQQLAPIFPGQTAVITDSTDDD
jgi:hypothetical protein